MYSLYGTSAFHWRAVQVSAFIICILFDRCTDNSNRKFSNQEPVPMPPDSLVATLTPVVKCMDNIQYLRDIIRRLSNVLITFASFAIASVDGP